MTEQNTHPWTARVDQMRQSMAAFSYLPKGVQEAFSALGRQMIENGCDMQQVNRVRAALIEQSACMLDLGREE